MSIRAVYFDLGGVLVRTGDKRARTQLAAEFGMTYDEMDRFVFECESAALASLGRMSEEQHWLDVTRRLGKPESEVGRISSAFFGGDSLDLELVEMLRRLRKTIKTGLISNAWSGLRAYITESGFADAFDSMIISAEVGIVKPDARIYQLALERLGAAPEEAIFVDDMEKNVRASQNAGMHGILFRSPEQVINEITQLMKN